jgi:pyruvate/2-oxoglutarate/acetoin dehydrogenase E1 component
VTELQFRDAVRLALADELRSDDRVILFGEDVAAAGGVFKTTPGLLEEFGEHRVRDTPISEVAIVGAAIGAALTGLRPVVDLMFADFIAVAFDQVVNQAAKHRYLTGGQCEVPLTIRVANGAGSGFGAQHSQSVDAWLYGTIGLVVVAPATPSDAYGLLRSAIREPNPVVFLEHKLLYGQTEHLVGALEQVPLRKARIAREGEDVTVVATQLMVQRAQEAAATLAERGVSVEVVDLRTVWPPDLDTIAVSVRKTGRLVVVEEATPSEGWAAALIADLMDLVFDDLDARPRRVTGDPTPIPYARSLEAAWMPDAERIAAAVSLTI